MRRTIYFDVDDTLLLWPGHWSYDSERTVKVGEEYLTPHRAHVKLLKELAEDWDIVVWTQGGRQHAENAAAALGIEEYVTACLGKPDKVVDDITPSYWLPPVAWLKETEHEDEP